MSALDDARDALDLARQRHTELGDALDLAQRLIDAAVADQEFDRLRALTLAMNPKTPDLVGDVVPAEWLDEPKEDQP